MELTTGSSEDRYEDRTIAERSGFSVETIRFYEKLGFLKPRKLSNGYRSYSEEMLEECEFITLGKSLGFSLREIREFRRRMISGEMSNEAVCRYLSDRIVEIDRRIASLENIKAMLRNKIDECSTSHQ